MPAELTKTDGYPSGAARGQTVKQGDPISRPYVQVSDRQARPWASGKSLMELYVGEEFGGGAVK